MEQFLQLLFGGLALGAVYALVALGFVVIYRASQVFNFAHGELLAFGAFLMVALTSGEGALTLPWPLALVTTMLATGLLAAGVERAVLRPMVGRPIFVTIILTLFVAIILRVAIVLIWDTQTYAVPTPWETTATVDIAGANVLVNALVAIAAGALALAAFFTLIRLTRFGVAMRATASDQEAALAHGVPVGRVFGASWFIAGALAALAGVFVGVFPRQFVDINLGFIAFRAFPAVIVGGLDSPLGAVVAGFGLGVLQLMTEGYISPLLGDFGRGFHEVLPYLVMIVFLMVRPYGLFGTRQVERV